MRNRFGGLVVFDWDVCVLDGVNDGSFNVSVRFCVQGYCRLRKSCRRLV